MIEVMRDRTIALIDDFRRRIITSNWDNKLYNQPLWKHIYHALYWFDYGIAHLKILSNQIFTQKIYTL